MIAIVLAAGRGSRLGGPKVLLSVNGEPLVAQHVRRLREFGCTTIMVVVPRALVNEVRTLVNDPVSILGVETRSQGESLRAALASLKTSDDRVLVTPIDLLPARLDTLRALSSAIEGGAIAAVPRHAGRNGHPLLVRWHVLNGYLLSAKVPPLNEVVAPIRSLVGVNDPTVLGDFDTHDDLPDQRPNR